MNDREFKRHLSALIRGHHHPEEHDWTASSSATAKAPAKKRSGHKKTAVKRARKEKTA